ncbi:MAG: ATP-dependent DNA ligase [Bacteroidota bacterium]
MQRFAELFTQLDETTKTTVKVAALADYFAKVDDRDRLWTMALLSHRRPKRTVNTTLLRQWAAEMSGLPNWLFEDSYHIVGDLAETIALLLPPPSSQRQESLTYWITFVQSLGQLEEGDKRSAVIEAWSELTSVERFIFNKLITGGFRMGVSQKLMVRALSKYTGLEEPVLAHRLMGKWDPATVDFQQLIIEPNEGDNISRPYPFFLAYQLEKELDEIGTPAEWQAEHKWDGIRGQLIVRKGELFVWSRGEELVTDKFPEYHSLAQILPDGTVLDGEILPWRDGLPLDFNDLQTRIGRKNVTKKILEKAPVILMAYDLLEWQGEDIRKRPLSERRHLLEKLVADYPNGGILQLSQTVQYESWEALAEERETAREKKSEGIMLKRLDSPYQTGRKRGNWWKWKVDPLTVDAVMIYAQQGHGRRANLFTDFTFAVWDGERLVPFTKAYSGLTDKEFREITRWVKANTIERFGPVRSVKPTHVFEIAFEGIRVSTRHKSGIALRFPRMLRWRRDKPIAEANTLEDLKGML